MTLPNTKYYHKRNLNVLRKWYFKHGRLQNKNNWKISSV